MSNEEPQVTPEQNVQLPSESHKLPEQSKIPQCNIPRPFDFDHLIHQWQPMGIRVTLNLPFTGNDQDYIFAIRNGPFIPTLFYQYKDSSCETTLDPTSKQPSIQNRKLTTMDTYQCYAFNNMRNVTHAGKTYTQIDPDQQAVYITQYDAPPILASLATMFRKWRGTMHYRIRTVAGFTTQGYIFSSVVRNSPSVVGIYPTEDTTPGIQREDRSYRESMINSYVMGDTAMFRHFEVEVPFEYPVPFYDQFNWIGNRSRPAKNFMTCDVNGTTRVQRLRNIHNEPHGDNYILFGLRGKLESSVQNSQITFELEYRAGDDFQFADPFLPYNAHFLTPYSTYSDNKTSIIQVPSKDYFTDGLHDYSSTPLTQPTIAPVVVRDQNPADTVATRPKQNTMQAIPRYDPVETNVSRPRNPRPRTIRDLTSYDTVDYKPVLRDEDLVSEPGDDLDLLDLKRNLRKSLRVGDDVSHLLQS
ncbi:putative capsid protein [Anoplolepis gracilipes virus 3]|nr:putative capsid protein [Anoplolepis gracilipes virus 3]